MRSERELSEECDDVFKGDLNCFLTHLILKVEQNLTDGNLLSAKFFQEDVNTVKYIKTRREEYGS